MTVESIAIEFLYKVFILLRKLVQTPTHADKRHECYRIQFVAYVLILTNDLFTFIKKKLLFIYLFL